MAALRGDAVCICENAENPTGLFLSAESNQPPYESMLARIQQIATLLILLAASIVLLGVWRYSALLAVVLFCATLFSYSLLLAIQFSRLRWINADDPAPRASGPQLSLAWYREVVAVARVFLCWQPFCAKLHADNVAQTSAMQGRRGLVLVHGFLCNRAVWWRWYPELECQNIPFVAVNLEPVFGSIDAYADTLDKAIRALQNATGVAPLMVCHSMGGLVARAFLRAPDKQAGVHHVVTIGSPHHGTRLGERLLHPQALKNAVQMRRGSAWLKALEQKEANLSNGNFTCYYSDCDNIVTPASAATLAGADNRLRKGVPHVALALDDKIIRETLAML